MNPFITITCLLSLAATIKADDLWGGPVYAPGHATVDYYGYPSYAFEYAVKDPHTGDDKAQWEKRHGDVVKGAYSLVEPDGSLRIVEYYADDKTGFNAVVKHLGPSLHPATVHAAPSIYKAPIPVLGSPSVVPISVGSVSKLAGLASAPLLSGPLVGGAVQPISNYLPIAKTYAPLASILPAPIVKPLPALPSIIPTHIERPYPIISPPIIKSSPYLHAPIYQTPIVKSTPILQSNQLPLFRTPVIAPPSIPSPIIRPVPLTPPPIAPGSILKASPILSEPLFNPVIKSNPISIGEHLNIGQGYLDGLGYDLGKGPALTGLNNYLDNAWMGDKY